MTFRKGLIGEIRARAAGSGDEVCGLLLGGAEEVTAVLHCRNAAPDPAVAFEIDPAQLIAALRDQRQGGPAVVGCYHSHPGGSAHPSPRDAAEAAASGWLWLIVGAAEARLWRALADGAVHHRFDPVPLRHPGESGGDEKARR